MNGTLSQADDYVQQPLTTRSINHREWYMFLPKDQRQLIDLSVELYQRELRLNSMLQDYSFIVFPMAKAYEGFLKLYLFELGLISEKTFEGRRFRIGRALNPDIRQSQRDEYWLYDDVAQFCGKDLARFMWDTWLECRNQLFHYFPHRFKNIKLTQVEDYLLMMDESISRAYQCKLDINQNGERDSR